MAWLAAPLQSERLYLRGLNDGDRPLLTSLMRSPDVRAFLGGPMSAEQVADTLAGPIGRRWGVFCVVRTDSAEPIGTVTLRRERGELEIAYQFLPEHWGHGFAREAVQMVVDWLWETTDEDVVIAVTQVAHSRSRSLLEDLGMRSVAEFEEFGALQKQYELGRPDDDGGS
jgi:RimJ/RimL family protein N-acetyltransferase